MISIIVPVYNVEKYLKKCVGSLINQTYKDIEIILVDDGSTDNSGTICDEISTTDTRIKVIHKMNGGLSSARNAGIDMAKGDYLAFVDSDDFVELDMYETLLDGIEKNGKDISCCGRIVDIFGQYSNKEFVMDSPKMFTKEETIREILYLENVDVSACDKLYDKNLFSDIRYPEGKISEDAAVIFEIIERSNGIYHVGVPFYHYVFRNNSITKSKYSAKRHDVINNLNNTEIFLEKNHPDLLEDYKVYCAVSVGALILDMENDPESMKQYPEHYSEYRNIFADTVNQALKSRKVNKKMKTRLFALKTHTTKIFMAIKKIYAFIRKTNPNGEDFNGEYE